MKGMDEVGRLFNANQMIVAEVLQSAEAMKAAVAHLEPHMEKSESASKGKIILATVKGDVHDIGKNLVEIILSNNGYSVVNLGIKVPPEELIKAFREHRPDAIGLSGLLVKSAQMMVATAQDLKTAGIDCPILVGGAALSNRFTRMKIAPEYPGLVAYANDAMNGLDLANQIMDFERRESLKHVLAEQSKKMIEAAPKVVDAPADAVAANVVGAPRRRDSAAARPEASRDSQLRPRRDLRLHQSQEPVREASRLSELRRGARGRRPQGARAARSCRGSCAADARAHRHLRQRRLPIFPRAIRRRSHRHDFFARRQDECSRRSPSAARATRRICASPTTSRRAIPAAPTTCACSSRPSAPACARWPRNGRTRATTSARTSCKCSRSKAPRRSPSCCM